MTDWMRLALVEGGRVVEKVYPYPGVGVVLVQDDKLVAKAHNEPPSTAMEQRRHAEIILLDEARTRTDDLSQCVLYTNLEPCANVGLTESCTDAIIRAGIKEVHIAVPDPYHLVRGHGIKILEEAGVKVVLGEYENEERWQNRRYLARFCPHCGWPVVD